MNVRALFLISLFFFVFTLFGWHFVMTQWYAVLTHAIDLLSSQSHRPQDQSMTPWQPSVSREKCVFLYWMESGCWRLLAVIMWSRSQRRLQCCGKVFDLKKLKKSWETKSVTSVLEPKPFLTLWTLVSAILEPLHSGEPSQEAPTYQNYSKSTSAGLIRQS